ncbi:serine beta-lactamase-like protein LACTB, mitochondrial isoform X2 [Folsomia candida]|uniref:serine beta-lactamase-like protein LACTB, mitochondrial isoform X2 n=1 Tax=Folsomia candida TaxID=158441 RepID=UPI001604D681|nr:serine beta-lactamase-like protein LACTB, mitochondrial isoform X2 [Folsomia candida]
MGTLCFDKVWDMPMLKIRYPCDLTPSFESPAYRNQVVTMAMLAKQMEDGKVDIDLPVQTYLPDFPKKKWEGSDVTITVRHLLSHISGIRHYRKKEDIEKKKKSTSDSDFKEFFCQEGCESVTKALEIFQNDELIYKPGTTYYYTTHGWTVVSAVIEKITKTPFDKHAKRMFQIWGLQNTYMDEHNPIITNRGRYYRRDKESELINAPWVDNSCKWAGGGFLSTVDDLVKFSHIMLYSAQQPLNSNGDKMTKAFLKRETIQKLWTGDKATAAPCWDSLYALGWVVGDPFSHCVGCNSREEKVVWHSGGAVGASSILLIQFPPKSDSSSSEKNTDTSNVECVSDQHQKMNDGKVRGIVVAMITNLQNASLTPTAEKLTQEFAWMMDS